VSKCTAVTTNQIAGDAYPAKGQLLYGQHTLKMEEDRKNPSKNSKTCTSKCEASSHVRPATLSFPVFEHYYKSVGGKKIKQITEKFLKMLSSSLASDAIEIDCL